MNCFYTLAKISEKKEAKINKRSKTSNFKETPPIVLGEYKCFFCGVASDISNLCAGGKQRATSEKISKEKNWAFSVNLWQQASKLQDSRVLSFLSLESAVAQEMMNYHFCWIWQKISSFGYCRSQRATIWFIQDRTPFSQDSNACTQLMMTSSQCILCPWTRKDLYWTSVRRLYWVHSTCYMVCTETESWVGAILLLQQWHGDSYSW